MLLLQAVGGAIASSAASKSTVSVVLKHSVMLRLPRFKRNWASISCWQASPVKSPLSSSLQSAVLNLPSGPAPFHRNRGHPYISSTESTAQPNSPSSTRNRQSLNSSLPKSPLRPFLVGLCIAAVIIFIRSVFRVAELSAGFHGPLASHQISLMILEGVMACIASLNLTILHP